MTSECERADQCKFDPNCSFYAPGCEQFEEESPLEMTEKMLGGIMAIAIIYELVKPGRVGMVRKMIDAIVAKIPVPKEE